VYIYVYAYMYVGVYVCIYIYIHARVGVHMHSCRRILFICTVQSLYYMRVYHKCFLIPACVCVGGLEVGVCFRLFMVSACCWRGRLCFGRGRDRGFCLVYFSIFAGVRLVDVCVFVYARTHTLTTWILDVSLGVGRTPGEPEELRSTKAQYTCRPYMCTKYICLYICWATGFDDLG